MIDLKRVSGAVFDLDGTLLDSMEMWQKIDREYLKGFGRVPPEDLQRRIEGFSVTETAQFFQTAFDISDSIDRIIADWNRMARAEYLERLPLKDGAAELVKKLAALGIRLGIATTNYRDLTEGCLARHGILPLFSAVVTSGEIEKGKPDPEIYLKAAAAIGVKPENCLVFEDLPAGILAGKRAGMQTVAVYDRASAAVDNEKRKMADDYAVSPAEWLRNNLPD